MEGGRQSCVCVCDGEEGSPPGGISRRALTEQAAAVTGPAASAAAAASAFSALRSLAIFLLRPFRTRPACFSFAPAASTLDQLLLLSCRAVPLLYRAPAHSAVALRAVHSFAGVPPPLSHTRPASAAYERPLPGLSNVRLSKPKQQCSVSGWCSLLLTL